jgi:hydrogenase maturation protein HypF
MNAPDCVAATLTLHSPGPAVFAGGAWLKNAVAVTRGDVALVSCVVGNLNTPEACQGHDATADAFLAWLGDKPAAFACDLHPDFHSSREAARRAHHLGVPLVQVQHHHAHIGALCAEHGVEGPVIGLALDGVGLGTDGKPWGGELLVVDGARWQRTGHLRSLQLPGGDKAAREPWRVAASVLYALGRGTEIAARYGDEPAAAMLPTMLERGINSPGSSSAGRVFDAAAGLLGLSHRMEFEAQAAILLEQAAARHIETHGWPQPQPYTIGTDGELDLFPALGALTEEKDSAAGAAKFHATLVAAMTDWALRAAADTGIGIVACGGGCFLNKLLSTGLRARIEAAGLRMIEARQVSSGWARFPGSG